MLLHLDGELSAPRLVAAGVGPRDRVDADALRTAGAAAAQSVARVGGTVLWLLDESLPLPLPEQAARARRGHDPRRLLAGTLEDAATPTGVRSTASSSGTSTIRRSSPPRSARRSSPSGRTARATSRTCRRTSSIPSGSPRTRRSSPREHEHLTAQALGPRELEELGMGALAAVGRGSRSEPRLVVVRYDPPQPSRPDILLGLVGKAITFDSGGLSLKPAAHMEDMKGDMAGGAGTLHGIGAIAALGLPVRAVAVLAAAENLPGGDAFRPGDILRAANGKTIEIVNTDAEGRLVLADALWYARREGATHVLDLATLTGAMELALGDLYAGVFANDDEWRDRIVAAGTRSGDLVWPFPLHARYRRYVDSAFADMKNASLLRQGSPALAAEFLHEFAGDGPWAHVDMAGPGFLERSRGDTFRVPGGTGFGVRLIAELATDLS